MSVREEDRKKTASTSRGLGLATAAIGLGVGAAALYYFLNKGSPNQETEGASSSDWSYERANVFGLAENASDTDSYSTISEGTTSDTSVHDKTFEFAHTSSVESYRVSCDYTESDDGLSMFHNTMSDISNLECISSSSSSVSDMSIAESYSIDSVTDHSQSDTDYNQSEEDFSDAGSDYAESDKESDNADSNNSEIESDSAESDNSELESGSSESDNSEVESGSSESDNSEVESDSAESDMSIQSNQEDTTHIIENTNLVFENASHTESLETGYTSLQHMGNSENDSDTMEWDITNTSIGIPSEERSSSLLNVIEGLTSRISPRKARERPWTLEECSICFEVMLRDQEIMTLSCTHNFHAQCIMPWLQEKQTCPNCRKHAE